jgi:hypothetical protein
MNVYNFSQSPAPQRKVKMVQFGILSPEETVTQLGFPINIAKEANVGCSSEIPGNL